MPASRRCAALLLPLWLALGAAACAPEDEVLTTHLALRLPEALDCRPPAAVDALEVRALGDFPTTDGTVAVLGPEELPSVIDRFPVEAARMTVVARVGAEWRAGGVRVVPPGDLEGPVLLLPFGRSCPAADPAFRARPGAAVAPLPDGGLLIAGGHTDGVAVRDVLRLPPGEQRVERVDDGLQVTRTGATATATGALVVIAGGAQGAQGVAHDTYEVYDAAEGRMRFGEGRLRTARREHGAVPMPDGRVLIVGGRSAADAPPLGTAELVDAAGGEVRRVAGSLAVPRVRPEVRALDDGTVLVIGGSDVEGAAVSAVERFDPVEDGFAPTSCDVPGAGTAVPLPGARAAWVGVDPDADRLEVTLIRRGPGDEILCGSGPELQWPEALGTLAAAPLPDGRLLVTGEAGAAPRALVVDPGTGEVREAHASRVPVALVPFADGAVAELDADGASLRREALRTAFDNPPATLLAGSAAGVAFDAASRWEAQGALFVSRAAGARVDVPALRFEAVEIELEAEADAGEVELLLVRDGEAPEVVPHPGDGVLRWTHRGPPRVGIAVRAAPGAALRALRLARVP
ncbi:MAG: hypothetical protein ACODAU_01670 [Myxococcota bacterium]